jgi:mono/diheme cytochrome c family protein
MKSFNSRYISTTAGLSLTFALVSSGCASTPAGASDANLARAKSQASQGAELFARECASCHGQRGEGMASAPSIIGVGALPLYARENSSGPAFTDPAQLQIQSQSRPPGVPKREPFRTAEDLHEYVSTHMPLPKKRAGTLKPDEYWAIVNFVLAAHGTNLPEGGITPSNAGTIKI